jgi:DNA relaxase NicK
MQKSFAFDWIRVTTKNHNPMEMVREFAYGLDFEQWKATKPKSGYSHALLHPWGHSIFWHIDKKEMGVNIMFTGRACNELYDNGIDVISLIKSLSERKFRFTRLDLALDIRDVKIDIVGLLDCEHDGSINNDPVLIQKGKKARGGATLYAGSWTSDKFMRIYDKAKERGLDNVLWTRIEIQLAGRTATKVAAQMSEMTEEQCGMFTQRLIKGMYNPMDEVFQGALSGTPQRVSSTKNEEHNTYEWLMNVVAKTLARTIIELPHRDVMMTFEKEVNKHIREMAAKSLTSYENDD